VLVFIHTSARLHASQQVANLLHGRSQSEPTASVDLDILDATGNVLVHATMSLVPGDGGRSEGYQQMPLYTAPNQPFAPGTYRVRATAGTSSATLPFQVQ